MTHPWVAPDLGDVLDWLLPKREQPYVNPHQKLAELLAQRRADRARRAASTFAPDVSKVQLPPTPFPTGGEPPPVLKPEDTSYDTQLAQREADQMREEAERRRVLLQKVGPVGRTAYAAGRSVAELANLPAALAGRELRGVGEPLRREAQLEREGLISPGQGEPSHTEETVGSFLGTLPAFEAGGAVAGPVSRALARRLIQRGVGKLGSLGERTLLRGAEGLAERGATLAAGSGIQGTAAGLGRGENVPTALAHGAESAASALDPRHPLTAALLLEGPARGAITGAGEHVSYRTRLRDIEHERATRLLGFGPILPEEAQRLREPEPPPPPAPGVAPLTPLNTEAQKAIDYLYQRNRDVLDPAPGTELTTEQLVRRARVRRETDALNELRRQPEAGRPLPAGAPKVLGGTEEDIVARAPRPGEPGVLGSGPFLGGSTPELLAGTAGAVAGYNQGENTEDKLLGALLGAIVGSGLVASARGARGLRSGPLIAGPEAGAGAPFYSRLRRTLETLPENGTSPQRLDALQRSGAFSKTEYDYVLAHQLAGREPGKLIPKAELLRLHDAEAVRLRAEQLPTAGNPEAQAQVEAATRRRQTAAEALDAPRPDLWTAPDIPPAASAWLRDNAAARSPDDVLEGLTQYGKLSDWDQATIRWKPLPEGRVEVTLKRPGRPPIRRRGTDAWSILQYGMHNRPLAEHLQARVDWEDRQKPGSLQIDAPPVPNAARDAVLQRVQEHQTRQNALRLEHAAAQQELDQAEAKLRGERAHYGGPAPLQGTEYGADPSHAGKYENYREYLVSLDRPGTLHRYEAPHFTRGSEKRPDLLFHVRADLRTAYNTTTGAPERVLFVREIQSDYFQAHGAGGKGMVDERTGQIIAYPRGFAIVPRLTGSDWQATVAPDVQRVVAPTPEGYAHLWDRMPTGWTQGSAVEATGAVGPWIAVKKASRGGKFLEVDSGASREMLQQQIDEHVRATGVPRAPWRQTEDWAKLAIRHIVQQAATEGITHIVWTPGALNEWAKNYGFADFYDKVLPRAFKDVGKELGATLTFEPAPLTRTLGDLDVRPTDPTGLTPERIVDAWDQMTRVKPWVIQGSKTMQEVIGALDQLFAQSGESYRPTRISDLPPGHVPLETLEKTARKLAVDRGWNQTMARVATELAAMRTGGTVPSPTASLDAVERAATALRTHDPDAAQLVLTDLAQVRAQLPPERQGTPLTRTMLSQSFGDRLPTEFLDRLWQQATMPTEAGPQPAPTIRIEDIMQRWGGDIGHYKLQTLFDLASNAEPARTKGAVGHELEQVLPHDPAALAGSPLRSALVTILKNPTITDQAKVVVLRMLGVERVESYQYGPQFHSVRLPENITAQLANGQRLLGGVPFDPAWLKAVGLPAVGAAVGAGVGIATAPEDETRGGLLGRAALGAVVGAVGGRTFRDALAARRARAVPSEAGAIAIRPVETPPTEPPALKLEPPEAAEAERQRLAPRPGGLPVEPPVKPEDYANFAKFDLDPTGKARLEAEVERVVTETGVHPKQTVTWGEVRKAADQLGLDVHGKGNELNRRISGARLLAIRNIISANIDRQEQWAGELADATITPARRGQLERMNSVLDAQNSNLLSEFVKQRSAAGRELNALKIVAKRSLDPNVWWLKARQLANRDLTTDELVDIRRLLNERDRAGLISYVARLRKTPVSEQLVTLWKAGLLTNPHTHVINITSNTAMAALETAKDPVAAGFDWLMSLWTQQRTKGGISRQLMENSRHALRQGFAEAGEVLKGRAVGEDLERGRLPRETAIELPGLSPGANALLDGYQKYIFRALGAADRVYYHMAVTRSLTEQATLAGRKMGMRGVVLRDYVQGILRGQGALADEMTATALKDAAVATFRDQTRLGKAATAFARDVPGGQFIVPFQRTPGAVATRIIEYSPLGLGKGIVDGIRASLKGGNAPVALQRMAAEELGRGATGSGLIAIGYWLADKGQMTGAAPTLSERERQRWRQEGRRPNALLVKGQWLDIGRLSPVGNLLALGANFRTALGGEGVKSLASPERLAELAFSGLRTVADQPFVTGASQALNALQDPEREAARFAQGLAGSVVPAGIAAVARATDIPRAPELDQAGPLRGIAGAVAERIPGLRRMLPPRRDVFGHTQTNPGVLNAMFSPATANPDLRTRDPVIRELAEAGYAVPRLPRDKGEGAVAYERRQRLYGAYTHATVTRLLQSNEYANATALEAQIRQQAQATARDPRFQGISVERIQEALMAKVKSEKGSHTRAELLQRDVDRVRTELRKQLKLRAAP